MEEEEVDDDQNRERSFVRRLLACLLAYALEPIDCVHPSSELAPTQLTNEAKHRSRTKPNEPPPPERPNAAMHTGQSKANRVKRF